MNVTAILEELGIDYATVGQSPHVTANYVGCDCGSCSPGSRKYKLGISLMTGYTSCWTCGPRRLPEVLVELSGASYAKVMALLGDLDGVSREKVVRGCLKIPRWVGPLMDRHKNYIVDRGIDLEQAERLWGLKGIGMEGRLKWRIWIPISENGVVRSWTTRTIGTKEPRYVAAGADEESVSAKDLLLGEEMVRGACIVVEGGFDAMRVGPGAVATCGLSYTKAQVMRIARVPVRAIVFDHSPEAQRRADELCSRLEALPGKTYRVDIDAADPGSASDREIEHLRRAFLE